MALTDAERQPLIVENGRVPLDVDPDRDILNAEDAALTYTSDLPDGEFRIGSDDGNTAQVHG